MQWRPSFFVDLFIPRGGLVTDVLLGMPWSGDSLPIPFNFLIYGPPD